MDTNSNFYIPVARYFILNSYKDLIFVLLDMINKQERRQVSKSSFWSEEEMGPNTKTVRS